MHFYIFLSIEIFLIIIVIYCFYKLNFYKKRLRRNDEVYKFRAFIIDHYPDYYELLPDYRDMVEEDKPLTLESYLPQLKK